MRMLLPLLLCLLRPAASPAGLWWSVSTLARDGVEDFLLGANPRHWANSSLSLAGFTAGILQQPSLAINRSGHLVVAYPSKLTSFAPYIAAGYEVFIDVGPGMGEQEEGVPRPTLGLNCSAYPTPAQIKKGCGAGAGAGCCARPTGCCVTPGDLACAAFGRKEELAQGLLAFLVEHKRECSRGSATVVTVVSCCATLTGDRCCGQ